MAFTANSVPENVGFTARDLPLRFGGTSFGIDAFTRNPRQTHGKQGAWCVPGRTKRQLGTMASFRVTGDRGFPGVN